MTQHFLFSTVRYLLGKYNTRYKFGSGSCIRNVPGVAFHDTNVLQYMGIIEMFGQQLQLSNNSGILKYLKIC